MIALAVPISILIDGTETHRASSNEGLILFALSWVSTTRSNLQFNGQYLFGKATWRQLSEYHVNNRRASNLNCMYGEGTGASLTRRISDEHLAFSRKSSLLMKLPYDRRLLVDEYLFSGKDCLCKLNCEREIDSRASYGPILFSSTGTISF